MSIHKELANIQQSLAVEKGKFNDFSKFNYRSAEDILHALKPLLGDHSLIIDTRMEGIGDRVYVAATATISNGEESLSATGYAREALIKKGMDDAQVTGAATSYAKKYALGNLFAIDNEKDADSMDNRVPDPTYTAEQKAEFDRLVAAGEPLPILVFTKTIDQQALIDLANSFPKGKKTEQKQALRDSIKAAHIELDEWVAQLNENPTSDVVGDLTNSYQQDVISYVRDQLTPEAAHFFDEVVEGD